MGELLLLPHELLRRPAAAGRDQRRPLTFYARPPSHSPTPPLLWAQLGEEGSLAVFSHKHSKWHQYKFDRVFGEESAQDEVYAETAPLIRCVLDGERRD